MSNSIHTPDRRLLIQTMAMAGSLAALHTPGRALMRPSPGNAANAGAHRGDWQWLVGNWDVWHRRLKERLAGSDDWIEFTGRSACWLTMGGLGTIDDNVLDLPGGTYRGAGVRAFDPATGKWSIWWIDGRNPTRIDPPVVGGFEGDEGVFTGTDSFDGQPIDVRFRWHETRGKRPHWDQAFSTDGGKSWEINWRNYFTRTGAAPTPLPLLDDSGISPRIHDWDFLAGRWNVHHRRLKDRLAGSNEWIDFDGTFLNWPILGGQGNVGDNVMNFPGGTIRGVGFRTFDPASEQWSSWWIDNRNSSIVDTPLRGGFSAGGTGTFLADDSFRDRPIKVRVIWSRISATTARWEQAFSPDRGRNWETNWISDFTRAA